MNGIKKFFKNTIVLFALIGIILFYIYSVIADFYERKNKEITISSAQIELLNQTFARTWNRQPTEEEMQNLINEYVKSEVFYREAVALGVDKTDPAIKTRMRQVMELMLNDNTSVNPTRAQLEVYLAENEDKFRAESVISFQHLYFPLDEKEEADQMLAELNSGRVTARQVNRAMSMIPSNFENEPQRIIDRTFGNDFTTSIFELEPGSWQGPIQSAYGWHLVEIADLQQGKIPPLDDIWDEVSREWTFERQEEVKQELYQKMENKYEVIIEN